ncbi:transposase [Bradyrhizobium sp. USDA 4011]
MYGGPGRRKVAEPDWSVIARELKRKHVTLQVLWDEYIAEHPDGYRYSRFCDNGFMNESLKMYCEQAGIFFTRCRPYRKNDQAFVEQKNGAVVRRMVGYHRFEGLGSKRLLCWLSFTVRLACS